MQSARALDLAEGSVPPGNWGSTTSDTTDVGSPSPITKTEKDDMHSSVEFNIFTGKPIIKRCETEYIKLAGVLLGDELTEAPLALPSTFEESPPPNPGDLTDSDEQRLAARVCQLVVGMTCEQWARLDEERRIPWMQEAAAKARSTSVVDRVRDKAGQGESHRQADLSSLDTKTQITSEQRQLGQARSWLQARFLEAPEKAKSHNNVQVYESGGISRPARDNEQYFLAIPRREFHDYLLSIGASVAEIIRLCQTYGWLTLREGGFDVQNLHSFYGIMPTVVSASAFLSTRLADHATTQGKRFRVALSFPGEHRQFVVQVADVLAKNLGRDRVFYDKYYEHELARPNLDTYLQEVYHDHSDLIAVFLCAEYEKKDWCGLEWRAIRDLIKKKESAAIMPFRFDTTTVAGLFSIDGYIEIGKRSPDDIASLILKRLKHNDKECEISRRQERADRHHPDSQCGGHCPTGSSEHVAEG
jgi:hypothetical protein